MGTVASCLAWAEQCLLKSETVAKLEARSDSFWLLAHVLDKNQAWLRAHDEYILTDDQHSDFQKSIKRRGSGEPVAYIVGQQGFWNLDLSVTPATLVPRPETELLVETALALGSDRSECSVVDLGTGSGAIALALAGERPSWCILATDKESAALAIAQKNARRYELGVSFLKSEWFRGLGGRLFDLIISNPPYIESSDPHLQQLQFEPISALISGSDGLDDIREICDQSPNHLKVDGWLLLEHGYDQAPAVRGLLEQRGFARVASLQDFAGHERVTIGQWVGEVSGVK